MAKNTNTVNGPPGGEARLDDVDRKLLGLLAQDSTRSYAELGRLLHLSPPAVHERTRRLKRDRVILSTVARLDGTKLGRPLLTFVHVINRTIAQTRQIAQLSALPEIEEIHTVTGEAGMLLKVRTRDTQALEALLAKIHAIEGVEGTRSQIALSTLLERGPSPELR